MGSVKTIAEKKKRSKSRDAVLACDLFAGAGGFSLGAHLAGIEVAAAIEIDKYACQTYRENLINTGLAETHLFEADIAKLSPAKVKAACGFGETPCDILLGGPPCQGFSAHRLNDAGVNDPRNELLLRYFEYVRVLRPVFFLVENVPGLLWPKHKKFLDAFYDLADRAGYGVMEPQTINAKDFGVPQNRRRVFILGYDSKRISELKSWPPRATHVSPDSDEDLPRWLTASIAFRKALPGDPNNIHMNHGPELLEVFQKTPPNGGSRKDSGRVLPCHEEHAGHHDVYGRIDPTMPGPTMTTACINPSKGRFVHPTQHHGITLRQAARLQSFPDWFNFEGGIMAGGKQVGNAVPVDLAKALLQPLRSAVVKLRKAEEKANAA
ncbi:MULTISPECIES: DNA cytosine methyltransferase [unclassified Bradyrhizobium]|uniref:DNA cytosine methyltransferase n=1 Tax=unclassified Bradyrhizobium TaxID=2631580 RepID=UPI002916E38E|nr:MULTISPECIES: DNA cytosine methyltransferase [unclassified Bradyrhizobium]